MKRCGMFEVAWRLAECGRPAIACKLPATVRHMPASFRQHMATRVRDCLLFVIPAEPGPCKGSDHGTILVSWERKEADRIAAGAEIPRGEPLPPKEARMQIAREFSVLLLEEGG